MGNYDKCTKDCERMPTCTTCGKTKQPNGRSAPAETASVYCNMTCPGFYDEPTSGHLWPGELEDIRQHEMEDQP